jgi:hypothetical protein
LAECFDIITENPGLNLLNLSWRVLFRALEKTSFFKNIINNNLEKNAGVFEKNPTKLVLLMI